MFSHPPTLQMHSPSATTTEFTVTTRPPPSLGRTLAAVAVGVLRLAGVLGVGALLLAQHSLPPPLLLRDAFSARWLPLLHLPVLDPRTVYPMCAAVLWLVLRRRHTDESLLVIRSLGVQTSTTAGTWLGQGRRTRFIPTAQVRDIVVNEGFWGMEVRFYLAVVVEGDGGLVVVFPVRPVPPCPALCSPFPFSAACGADRGGGGGQTLLPNRHICEQVWRGARQCLYRPDAAAAGRSDVGSDRVAPVSKSGRAVQSVGAVKLGTHTERVF